MKLYFQKLVDFAIPKFFYRNKIKSNSKFKNFYKIGSCYLVSGVPTLQMLKTIHIRDISKMKMLD